MLWDDIDGLGLILTCSCGCKCGAAPKMSKFQQDLRVIQFLMGLNDSYAVMRGSILMSSPLPTISQVYCLLLQEESQREIHSSGHFMSDSASLNVNTTRFTNSSLQGTNYPKKSTLLILRSLLSITIIVKRLDIQLINAISFMVFQLISSFLSQREWLLMLTLLILLVLFNLQLQILLLDLLLATLLEIYHQNYVHS